MEGYLKKWINIVSRWQRRYVILHEDIITYCEEKRGVPKGSIHLKIASVKLNPEDNLQIVINSGTAEIIFRTENQQEKVQWFNAIKQAQETNYSIPQKYEAQVEKIQDQDLRQSLIELSNKKIEDLLTDIWCTQAQFEETLSLILPKLNFNKQLESLALTLQKGAENLKNLITKCCKQIEEEKIKILEYTRNIRDSIRDQQNETLFQSFIFDDDAALVRQQTNEDLLSLKNYSENQQSIPIENILKQLEPQQFKHKLFVTSPVYNNFLLPTSQSRNILPVPVDPSKKVKIFSILKDVIGQDLTKISMPVTINEPLSLLQTMAEQFTYFNLLQQGNKEQDPAMRFVYILTFILSPYGNTVGRVGKPFNPLLCETFDLITQDFKFVSEQVSHHPPISACYAFNDFFEFFGQCNAIPKFKGKYIQIQPQGIQLLKLKSFNETYSFEKCFTNINNIIMGEPYVDHEGILKLKNHSNNFSGQIKFEESSWMGKNGNTVDGFVQNANGEKLYIIKGKWTDEIIAIDVKTSKETKIWQKNPDLPNSKQYYSFNQFTMQLNHLHVHNISKLPVTDTRLRPDQRALELGQIPLATQEKNRLEEKQRAKKKIHKEDIPVWFKQERDSQTQIDYYKYKGGYFEARQSKQFPSNLADLF